MRHCRRRFWTSGLAKCKLCKLSSGAPVHSHVIRLNCVSEVLANALGLGGTASRPRHGYRNLEDVRRSGGSNIDFGGSKADFCRTNCCQHLFHTMVRKTKMIQLIPSSHAHTFQYYHVGMADRLAAPVHHKSFLQAQAINVLSTQISRKRIKTQKAQKNWAPIDDKRSKCQGYMAHGSLLTAQALKARTTILSRTSDDIPGVRRMPKKRTGASAGTASPAQAVVRVHDCGNASGRTLFDILGRR